MYLVRIILIGLIFYLLARSFFHIGDGGKKPQEKKEPGVKNKKIKGVPKELGEYVDYEEVKKK